MNKMPEKLKTVAAAPGVYMFKTEKESILYVGKARILRNRLRSYFNASIKTDLRKSALVREAHDFTFIVTESEVEALALEANLIKQHRPKYNIILKDDKNYPYLKVTVTEMWPKIDVVRRVHNDGNVYTGPYVSSKSMRETLDFIRKNFPLRTCNYRLESITRPCIDYQMGFCSAPCVGLINKDDYMEHVKEVIEFLNGKRQSLLDKLTEKMDRYSDSLQYEAAAKYRDKIKAIATAWEMQKVVDVNFADMDVLGLYHTGSEGLINVFFVRNGCLTGVKDFYIKDIGGVSVKELISTFIEQFYNKDIYPPAEIVVNEKPQHREILMKWLKKKRGTVVKITVPKDDKKGNLLKMANENAATSFKLRQGKSDAFIVDELSYRLKLSKTPASIGAFDISTISGSESVGAFIYWQNGGFRKEFYRHLKISTVTGIDDYSMMRETFERTAKNLGQENLPELVIIDGGRGQLEVAINALKDLSANDMPDLTGISLVSIAKKPDRVFFPDKNRKPLNLEDGLPSSLFLKRIRDEVHRFAITYHKKLRAKRVMASPLEKITGISKKRRMALLKHFDGITAIRNATVEEISQIDGFNKKLAEIVLKGLQKLT
ncbi:MAG: excinuclease ABC subunit UvrC [Nitrospirae bacterium]|nr:excinuclease ABC subunit UvrC [Nitrospirota bacterium]